MALLGADVAPRQHENRVPLLDRVAHERVRGLQIEHVELVDRRRDYDERPLAHGVGEWTVLDELNELVLQDDRARRDREIAAELESPFVRHRDAAPADVVDQVLDAGRQALAPGLQGEPQRLRIGGKVIRRAQGIQDLARKEAQPPACSLVDGGAVDEVVHVAGVDEIGPFEKFMEGALLPFLGGKPPIPLGRLNGFGAGLHHGTEPERAHLLQVFLLQLRKLGKTLEIGAAPALAQQLAGEVQHERLVRLREAGGVFDRHRVVHRTLNAVQP